MIAIIDYGRGNLGSVEKAFARVGIPDGAHFYFVHSYYPEPTTPGLKTAWCDYGIRFAAAIQQGAIHATQFHPEKSQRWGLRLLENFAAVVKEHAR